MERRHERSRARLIAVQALYAAELTQMYASEVLAAGMLEDDEQPAVAASPRKEAKVEAYVQRLLDGVDEHRELLDGYLERASEKWALMRMPIVDRAILRLACYEILFVDEVPASVSINEAVELAKDFGGEDESPRFVNGVLGNIAKRAEDGTLDAPEEPAVPEESAAPEEPAPEEPALDPGDDAAAEAVAPEAAEAEAVAPESVEADAVPAVSDDVVSEAPEAPAASDAPAADERGEAR